MNQIRSFVERIERIEAEIKEFNSDKSDIYAEAKGAGLDVKALKAVVARRRKDPAELSEHDAVVESYLAALDKPAPVGHARVRAQDDGIPDFLDRRTVAA